MSAPGLRVRRAIRRHWPLAAACACFLLAGALALDDYGLSADAEKVRRVTGMAALDYLAGDGERAFEGIKPHDRYFGAAFEALLVLAERILGLDDSRDVYLSRHLITHLFFLASGIFCYLLVHRMFGSRALALVAMALFLLHPRIYAHSFFNSKDPSFLAMFMIALWLVHRAFLRDTLGAFLLCGAGIGILTNLRIMGIGLFVAVLALRALDLAFTGSADERRRVLLTGGAFALAATLTYYASLPALWTDPAGRFAELIGVLRSHPVAWFSLFQGEQLYSPDGPPFDYAPVWVGITTPPATLLLAIVGAMALAWTGLRRPREVLRNGPLRFGLLLLALPVATMVAVVALRSNIYDDWRHLFFLYAPLLLLAVLGLRRLTTLAPGRWLRAGTYALAGAAIAVTVVSMARIHPYEDSYFSLAADRTTPEQPGSRYEVGYWHQFLRGALAAVAGHYPKGRIVADPRISPPFSPAPGYQLQLLPPRERERFSLARVRDYRSSERSFHVLHPGAHPEVCALVSAPASAVIHVARVHATTLVCVVEPVSWFGALRREAHAAEPLIRSVYDIHRNGRLLTYVRDECPVDDVAGQTGGPRFFLHVTPLDPDALPASRREAGHAFDNLDRFLQGGLARIDGDCMAVGVLPDHPIATIRTGQYADESVLWEVEFTPDGRTVAPPAPSDLVRARRDALASEPLARSLYAIHLAGRTLTYVRDGCPEVAAAARFFLHVVPAVMDDLPAWRRAHGFDNLDFTLATRGARIDGNCVAVVPLPAYPIAIVRTGQYDATGALWQAEFALPEGE